MTPLSQPVKKISPSIIDDWRGETVVCIGGGPSLTHEDVQSVADHARVIAINDAYKVAPWADILYGCDLKWWQWEKGVPGFCGEKWTQDKQSAAKYNLNYIEGKPGKGLSTDPSIIHTGQNSGFQAINLAYHKGARRVILLGYDMKFSDSGKTHWFGDHPDKIKSNYARFISALNEIAHQGFIEVINCSRDTALDCFKKEALEDIQWT